VLNLPGFLFHPGFLFWNSSQTVSSQKARAILCPESGRFRQVLYIPYLPNPLQIDNIPKNKGGYVIFE
jgi:hypothetical protein